MRDLFKKHILWKWLVYIRLSFLTLIPDDLKTQEMSKRQCALINGCCTMFPITSKPKKCAMRSLKKRYDCCLMY